MNSKKVKVVRVKSAERFPSPAIPVCYLTTPNRKNRVHAHTCHFISCCLVRDEDHFTLLRYLFIARVELLQQQKHLPETHLESSPCAVRL